MSAPESEKEIVDAVETIKYRSPAIHAGNRHLLTTEQKDMIERFSSGEVRMACLAPGSSTVFQEALDAATQVAQGLKLSSPDGESRAIISGRWSRTATDGTSVGSYGDPITLTWTVVPDGTLISDNASNPDDAHNGPSDLRARLDVIYGSESTWLPLFQMVFDDWESKTGINYVYVTYDDQGTVGNVSSTPGVLATRADIRIAGHAIDGDANVLAYNYLPSIGDMIIDTVDTYYENVTENSIRLRNIISHEHGHGLGLSHVCPIDNTKVMEPFLNFNFVGAQHDDIRGAHEGYGDKNGTNNTIDDAIALSTVHGTTLQETGMSIDKGSEVDFFSLDISQVGVLRITAKPVGSTYDHGSASGSSCPSVSPLDSTAQENLVVTVYDTDGTTILRLADNAAAGDNEIASTVSVNSTGTYYFSISSSSGTEAQLYDLDILLDDGVLSLGVPTTDTAVSFAAANLPGAEIQRYDAASQSYVSATDLNTKTGYFVKFISPYVPSFPGSAESPPISFVLSQGWNLLSIPTDNGASWDTTQIQVEKGGATVDLATATSNGWVYDYAWVYNESLGDYQAVYNIGVLSTGVSVIATGENFWFYAREPGVTMTFPAATIPTIIGYTP